MMQPPGRKKIRFPSKQDHHLPEGNWWENDRQDENKKADRREGKMTIQEELNQILLQIQS
jgi:hypothetical protein